MPGMLPSLFAPPARQEDQDVERNLQNLALMDPFQQAGYASLAGGRMAGQGLAQVLGAATNTDVRTPAQKNQAAIEAVKAQVAKLGLDPNDPKSLDQFYQQVIGILQRQGLVPEAAEMMKEWGTQKHQRALEDIALKKEQRAGGVADANIAYRQAQIAALQKKGVAASSQIGKMLQDWNAAKDRNDAATMSYLEKAIQNASAGKIIVENAGDRLILRDATTRQIIGEDQVGAKPMDEKAQTKQDEKDVNVANAYKEAKASLQQQYNAAVDLYNHPGLDGITGRVGRLIGEPGAAGQTATTLAGADSRGALNLWQQVTGSTFIAALGQLKAASPTGSTGLGAVSDAEGKKVQAAAAALGREQDAPEFRQRLATYIQVLEGAGQRLDAKAQASSIAPIPLQEKPLTGPVRRGSAPKAPAAVPAAPPAPTPAPGAPAGGAERWERVNGKLQRVK